MVIKFPYRDHFIFITLNRRPHKVVIKDSKDESLFFEYDLREAANKSKEYVDKKLK